MKVIVAGSRTITDEGFVWGKLDSLASDIQFDSVVCGCAKGPDSIAARWAEARGIPVETFPAEWDSWGKSAGMIRNRRMADHADYLIAFWDGVSRGTKNMISEMKRRKKHGRIIRSSCG